MVKVATFFGMSFGAFLFWKSMDKLHVWIALHQDEKEEENLIWEFKESWERRDMIFAPSFGGAYDLTLFQRKERLDREMEIKRVRQELLAEAKQNESLA